MLTVINPRTFIVMKLLLSFHASSFKQNGSQLISICACLVGIIIHWRNSRRQESRQPVGLASATVSN